MPLIFADAGTFTRDKSIPSLQGDVIAIELPNALCSKLKRMDRETTMRHFEHFVPVDYIVLNERWYPRYSSFKCRIVRDNREFTPIELTPQTQMKLADMVKHLKHEVSGLLKNDGIHNIQTGSPVKAPLQPDRTKDSIPFHTHPVGTYEMFSVNYGLPSSTDLNHLFTKPLPSNVFNAHLLLSREGIYAIEKKTCESVPKVHLNRDQFNQILVDCSFILLPWNFNRSWFIF